MSPTAIREGDHVAFTLTPGVPIACENPGEAIWRNLPHVIASGRVQAVDAGTLALTAVAR